MLENSYLTHSTKAFHGLVFLVSLLLTVVLRILVVVILKNEVKKAILCKIVIDQVNNVI